MPNIETARLHLRELTPGDATFVLELLNEPGFLRYIGDKCVRDLAGAEQYLRDGPLASYTKHRHSLWRVALKEDDTPVGICGLLKRDYLAHPDLGYAVLARHAGRGYTSEAATAVLSHGREKLKLTTIFALTAEDNTASISLLQKLGYTFDRLINLPEQPKPSRLFQLNP